MQDEISPEAIAMWTSAIEAKDILFEVSYTRNYFSYAVIKSSYSCMTCILVLEQNSI